MGYVLLRRWFLLLLLLVLQNTEIGNASSSSSSSTKLRVGVPKKDGFTQFVDVRWDNRQHKYNVSGYCIDVFNAVVKLLPFDVSIQFEPYVDQTGQSAGTYDSLVEQIPQRYDVVVGDVTIVANRSKYVDFTLPFTASGVSMLVKVEYRRHLTMWIFVKPFSWDLWVSIVIVSIFIGFVILVMERSNVNTTTTTTQLPQNDGSQPHHHHYTHNNTQLNVVSILWFPLSQAVLPEREVVVKNCSRFVLMVWLLLTFVLMQSYTASLTSMLTVDQLQPSFLSVNDLIKGGYYVGYQSDSFVYDLLVQRLKFNPSKLRPYSDVSDYHNALKKGSDGGGVAAIYDEIPYLQIFLAKYKSNYMMAGPTYRTDGFGFAFPLNSNLTSYFSRAILNVTESEIMDEIEKKYFGDNTNGAQDQTTSSSSNNTAVLTAHSFAGLFLVTGIATVLALIVSESVIWERPIEMARAYSERYLLGSSRSRDTTVHPFDDSSNTTTTNNTVAVDSTSMDAMEQVGENID